MTNSAVPTPYGWVLVAQNKFDLDEVVAFQTQLSNLARSIGIVRTNAPDLETAESRELVPVAVHSRR